MNILRVKKVILPGINVKSLRSLSSLLSPSELIIPFFFISVLGQLVFNLKDVLSLKEIQTLPSVKLYSKVLLSGFSTISFSILYSLSNTLGWELETLSLLNVRERIKFLENLKNNLIFDLGEARIYSKRSILFDPILLTKHRRGLSIQFRSLLVSSSIFSFQSIVFGLSIKEINLDIILESSKLMWLSLGLNVEEFDFYLRKQALSLAKKFKFQDTLFSNIFDLKECLRVLVYFELKAFYFFSSSLNLVDDDVVLRSSSNLTLLEKEVGFIFRELPSLSLNNEVTSSTDDLILTSSIEQRRFLRLKLNRVFSGLGKIS
uniref:Maturase n=1 Tax=Lepocinclis tripteris TaxID=135494 RepID=A0A3G3LKY6_9EUGL|nr:maturase [Lepocinclis tripteris]AYQ93368.1 maturase [Lepocinclis tripteris]